MFKLQISSIFYFDRAHQSWISGLLGVSTIYECFWKRTTCTLAFLAADSAFTWAGVLREGVFVGLANSSASLFWSTEADFVTGLLDFMSGCLAEIQIKTLKKVLTFIQTYTRPEVFVISYLLCTFSSATLFLKVS